MEHAISVDRISELERCSPNYHRVYVGSEFCERLIPAEKEVKTALKFCEKNGLGFTLVTPPLTYWGVARVKDILEILPEETEVVINDWGILKDVKRLKLTPVLGRLLVKYKRDPRISSIEGKIPKECREVLQSSSLTQKRFTSFLRELGFGRVELDNTPFRLDHGKLSGFKVSVHVPYVYVATTRQCLTNFFTSGEFGIRKCKRSCIKCSFTWITPEFPYPLIQVGNTLSYINPEIRNEIKSDRIIHDIRIIGLTRK